MTCKLHIDISQGVLEIEGEATLVREIYLDFRDRLISGSNQLHRAVTESGQPSAGSDSKPRAKRKSGPRKQAEGGNSAGVAADSPKLDKNLDTSKLADFYGRFEPKTNSEKILVFLKYLTDELGIENPNTDQVFTLFKKTGDKVPVAFAQAFYNMSSRDGFINFGSATDIEITIAGDNHFTHDLERSGIE